ncbi:hypothetical protein AB5I41_05530 [Sphingomonas sp. MMS24-JH45]
MPATSKSRLLSTAATPRSPPSICATTAAAAVAAMARAMTALRMSRAFGEAGVEIQARCG